MWHWKEKGEMTSLNKKSWASVCRDPPKPVAPVALTPLKVQVDNNPLCDDIISNILSRLPIESLMRSTCVCKTWYNLTKEPHFISMQVNKSRQSHRFVLVDQSRVLLLDGQIKTKEIPIETWRTREISMGEIEGKGYVSATCNGFICMQQYYSGPISVYNPITRECTTLPKSKTSPPNYLNRIGLGFDETSKKYKVVRVFWDPDIIFYGIRILYVEIITIGESLWRRLIAPYQVKSYEPVFLAGGFHWLLAREEQNPGLDLILTLDIVDEQFRTIKFPPSEQIPSWAMHSCPSQVLKKLGKFLAIVICEANWMNIWTLVGCKIKGYSVHQQTYDMSGINKVFKFRRYELVDILRNGSFLLSLQVEQYCYSDDSYECDTDSFDDEGPKVCFVQYFPREKKFRLVHTPDIPECFEIYTFAPNLESMCALSELQ